MALTLIIGVTLIFSLTSWQSYSAHAMTVRSIDRGPEGGRLTADFIVAAPPDQAFKILIDDGRFHEFIPYVLSSETLARSANTSRIRVRARHLGLFDFVVTYDRRYYPQDQRITWIEVGGHFKRNDGQWRLEPIWGAQTRVHYEIRIDPGFYVPEFLLSFALRQGLPELSQALRRRIESGGSWKKAGK